MDRLTALESEKNSLLFWIGIAEVVGVPIPRTVTYSPTDPTLEEWGNRMRLETQPLPDWIDHLVQLADGIGFPLFMRTDQAASKHKGAKTCIVGKPELLGKQLDEMIFDHLGLVGTPAPRAVVLREYLPPASIVVDGKTIEPFRAFGRTSMLPIGAERRWFVRDGKVECHHPYWPESSIKNVDPSVDNWQERLRAFSQESDEEIELLSSYARLLASKLDNEWSLDFMLTSRRGWVWIDAALASCSAHDPNCPYNLTGK